MVLKGTAGAAAVVGGDDDDGVDVDEWNWAAVDW